MEISPTHTERQRIMSDVALARRLVTEIAGHAWDGKGDMIDRVHGAVARQFPRWTRRRVRSLWHREAAGVRYHEMIELAEVARIERERRERERAAGAEHADFLNHIAATLDRLEATDADFHSAHREALRAMAGGQIDPSCRQAAGESRSNPSVGCADIAGRNQ